MSVPGVGDPGPHGGDGEDAARDPQSCDLSWPPRDDRRSDRGHEHVREASHAVQQASGDAAAAEGVDPRAVLADLPDSVWTGVLELLRRAFDELDRAHVPRRLRPYANWHPERLGGPRVRAAVVAALPQDARLRRALGEQAAAVEDLALAEDADVARLRQLAGPGVAAALLIGRDRWGDLAVLAAQEAEAVLRAETAADHEGAPGSGRPGATDAASLGRRSSAPRSSAPGSSAPGSSAPGSSGPGSSAPGSSAMGGEPDPGDGLEPTDMAGARTRREERQQVRELQRAVQHAEKRARHLSGELDRARERAERAERERDDLAAELAGERSSHRGRLARLRRQARQAQRDAADRQRRVEDLAGQLQAMAESLVTDPGRDQRTREEEPEDELADDETDLDAPSDAEAAQAIPRRVVGAVAGRPCVLPHGVLRDTVAAAEALLQVRDLEVLIDGYNVTKDLRGRPHAGLADQRAWLLRAVGGLAATRPVRPTIVFDGQGGTAASAPSARGVRVVFTEPGELADDRIKDYVEAMDPGTCVLVVTSDRDVRGSVTELGANIVSSGVFLKAIGASS